MTAPSVSSVKVVCTPWRPITYDHLHDTPETVKQVRVHNRTGSNLGCWPR